MSITAVTPAQQAFIDALKQQVGNQFTGLLDGVFEPMSVPNGMYYGIQAGPNNYYNQNFLAQVNQAAVFGDNGMMEPGGSTFSDVYGEILNAIVYTFSSADNKALDNDLASNQAQVQTVISSWEEAMGAPITDTQQAGAFPPSKLGYIQSVVESRWKGDVNQIPSAMQDFKNAYQSFQTSAQVTNRLTLQSAAGINRLNQIRKNLVPSSSNGSLQTGNSSYALAFGPFPTQNAINNSLQATNRNVALSFTVDNFHSDSSQLSISGETGFEIPIADIITFDFGGSASYTLDKYASSSTKVSTTITYGGVTIIGTPLTAGAVSEDLTKGWWANDVLAQAVGNTDSHQTGFSLRGDQFPVDTTFGAPDGTFSRIKTWLVSQEPTIRIEISGGEVATMESDFQEKAQLGVSLFGLIKIGSVSQSYAVQSIDSKSVSGSLVIELGAPDFSSGTTNLQDARAFVVGGVPSYPPTNP